MSRLVRLARFGCLARGLRSRPRPAGGRSGGLSRFAFRRFLGPCVTLRFAESTKHFGKTHVIHRERASNRLVGRGSDE